VAKPYFENPAATVAGCGKAACSACRDPDFIMDGGAPGAAVHLHLDGVVQRHPQLGAMAVTLEA